MKKTILFLILLMVAVSFGGATNWNINKKPTGDWLSGSIAKDTAWGWMKAVDSLVALGANPGTGKVFYVDSNVTTEGGGTSWGTAKDTIDEAINLCTANRGDVILVAQGHAETIAAANGFDADVAGITIIGLGNGSDRPTLTYSATGSDVAIGAESVSIQGLRFLAGISEVAIGVDIESAGNYASIIGCEFPEPTTSTFEFDKSISFSGSADDVLIAGNTFHSGDATGATHCIDLSGGVIVRVTIVNNTIYGEYSVAGIFSDDIDLGIYVAANYVTNLTAGQHAIEFTANSTGHLVDNKVQTNAIATAIDNGVLSSHGNTWISAQGSDMEAVQVNPIIDSTTNTIGFDDSDNAFASTNVTANSDGSILERLEAINQHAIGTTTQAGQTYATVMTATSQTDDLFDVAGGAILITSFTGVVTTQIGAVGNTIAITLDADAGFIDSDFSTAVETNADVVGTRYLFSNVTESVLTPVSDTAGNTNPMRQWFSGEGMIEQAASGATTGAIKWYITWIPFADGTTVTAQ